MKTGMTRAECQHRATDRWGEGTRLKVYRKVIGKRDHWSHWIYRPNGTIAGRGQSWNSAFADGMERDTLPLGVQAALEAAEKALASKCCARDRCCGGTGKITGHVDEEGAQWPDAKCDGCRCCRGKAALRIVRKVRAQWSGGKSR